MISFIIRFLVKEKIFKFSTGKMTDIWKISVQSLIFYYWDKLCAYIRNTDMLLFQLFSGNAKPCLDFICFRILPQECNSLLKICMNMVIFYFFKCFKTVFKSILSVLLSTLGRYASLLVTFRRDKICFFFYMLRIFNIRSGFLQVREFSWL